MSIAEKIKTRESTGNGCLVQGLALAVLIIFPMFGGIIGIYFSIPMAVVLFIAGTRLTYIWKCSSCGSKLVDKTVKICAICKANFS